MKNNPKGYVSFVLHAHLPFVHHPESEDYLEEQWLFEAISETYIPLLLNFGKLENEHVDFRITMSMTPPLLNMLDNTLLQERYIKYLLSHIELAKKEVIRNQDNESLKNLAQYYVDRYSNDLHVFKDVYKCNIISGFKHFQDIGVLEIITCGATHGYFPILYVNEKTVRAQIAVGVKCYEKYFGRKPRGIWLPECGYVPEADKYLREFGIQYVITETHGILYANPTPIYGTLAPIVSPDGIVAFGRDLESSRQVWSSINGYPGDFNYREWYRDIGYDAPYDYIKPYIACNGARVPTGIKYYRITGKNCEKDYYNLQWAQDSINKQAGHFFDSREKQITEAANFTENPPIVLCPYDAELYGHWWYEGPDWLYTLFKKIYYEKTEELGRLIGKRGHGLVFGGGKEGLMGAAARGVDREKGYILGIAPRFFDKPGVLYEHCTEFIFTENMRERKHLLESRSDATIVVPGGIGTYEEFFEILTLKSLGRIDRPIVLYNINGYYDSMRALLEYTAGEKFMARDVVDMCRFMKDPEEILDYIENYRNYGGKL